MIKKSIFEFILYSLVCGIIYPVSIYLMGNLFFPKQVNGSLIEIDGKVIGSELLGQAFSDPRYFWSRPSATSPVPYNGLSSGASNMALSNPSFTKTLEERIASYSDSTIKVPVDLVTTSGSGLDPEISIAAAKLQSVRVAQNRRIPVQKVNEIINQFEKKPLLGFIGPARVNVLLLNIELDKIQDSPKN